MKTKTQIKECLKIQKKMLKEMENGNMEDSEYAEISKFVEGLEWVLEV
jgi:hypothetical protein|tara:strand:+ start:100 stop:243 length:144 start_codon:yes stop_codon:yes gene_type:complete